MNISPVPSSPVSPQSGTTIITQLKKQKVLLEKGLTELNQSQETQLIKQTQGAAMQLDIQQIQLQIQQLEGRAPQKDAGMPKEPTHRSSATATEKPASGTLNTLA